MRHFDKLSKHEPTADKMEETIANDDTNSFLNLVSTLSLKNDPNSLSGYGFEMGHNFDWSSGIPEVRAIYLITISMEKY